MSFTEIELLPEELHLLRELLKSGPRKISASEQEPARSLRMKYKFIQIDEAGKYFATKDGRRYLQFRREDRFRHRWPVYLAIASFIISLISLSFSIFR